MKRGEVWWALLGGPAGHRPVLLVSRDEAYAVRGHVMVAPIHTRARGIEAEVPLGSEDGLRNACVANLDSLVTVRKSCLRGYVATLSSEKLRAVDAALRFALDLPAG